MSKRKIKNKKKVKPASRAAVGQQIVAAEAGLRGLIGKLTEDNKLLNGEASAVLEELFNKMQELENKVEDLEDEVAKLKCKEGSNVL